MDKSIDLISHFNALVNFPSHCHVDSLGELKPENRCQKGEFEVQTLLSFFAALFLLPSISINFLPLIFLRAGVFNHIQLNIQVLHLR